MLALPKVLVLGHRLVVVLDPRRKIRIGVCLNVPGHPNAHQYECPTLSIAQPPPDAENEDLFDDEIDKELSENLRNLLTGHGAIITPHNVQYLKDKELNDLPPFLLEQNLLLFDDIYKHIHSLPF